MKRFLGLLFLLWVGVILIVYYVVQKPGLLSAAAGLADTIWTLLVAAFLLFNAYGIGTRILDLIKFEGQDSTDSLLLSFGIGLGALGLLGLFFSALQLANKTLLTTIQFALTVLFLLRNDLSRLRIHIRSLISTLNLSLSQYSFFTKLALVLPLTFSFLLSLVPPFEAFDALLNHLTLPATILRDGGLRAVNILPFWYPGLTENVYLWALAFGSERAPQLIHLAWGILTILLLWHWSTKIGGIEIGRKTFLLLVSIPSLPMLASWAYVDMALAYYAVAAIYTATSYQVSKSPSLLYTIAILSGMAMGVKYQSFVIPLACVLILLFQAPFSGALKSALLFSLTALLVALPWYLRNAAWMGNPFYPFLFGGRYWDKFLAAWWADAGSGIGWNAIQMFMLPLNVTLGHRDATFFDGRFGPLFLFLFPLTLSILLSSDSQNPSRRISLLSIAALAALSMMAWTIGVINTAALWQARYLFPAVMALAVPTALAWESIKQLDTSSFRVSFLANGLIGIVILLTIFDTAVFVLQRNPLSVALGAQNRERYIERINPSYAALINLMDALPTDAQIYSLFEPRSYGVPRSIQPDPINANFAHDMYLYKTPDAILQQWKAKQYTHVIVYERGLDFMKGSTKFTPAMQSTLQATLAKLIPISQTPDHIYSLYKIP
ncbi:MAG TPA: hypothetical protein VK909_17900 [Anaerolineales bacterium]|nr:hypothetical protein [Anaerolineales bacterium]